MPEAAPESVAPAEPAYFAHDVEPRLTNGNEVLGLLHGLYPESLKSEGVGGRVMLWLHVDESGAVTEMKIHTSSGQDELDAAAQEVAASMRFTPAENNGEPVSVWIAQPIEFQPES
jgi:TonB family protein